MSLLFPPLAEPCAPVRKAKKTILLPVQWWLLRVSTNPTMSENVNRKCHFLAGEMSSLNPS
eukprot:572964-Prorocentrum_lima.AAC.1